jgi:hypothetical protein
MAYLRNSTVNLLNLHYGIHALAMNSGGTFFVVFLLKSGVGTPAVLASIAFILGGRFLIRPFVVVLATRCGLRPWSRWARSSQHCNFRCSPRCRASAPCCSRPA